MKRKKIYKISITILFIFVLTFLITSDKVEKVVFLAVGQGDASVISTQDRTILIDGGPNWQVLSELAKVLRYSMVINDVVITHPHKDHYLGLAELIKRYKVENIYYYPTNQGNDFYNSFLNIAKKENINLVAIKRGDKIKLKDGCYLYFLWPVERSELKFSSNELSIVNYFSCGKLKTVFTGDISKAVEKQLISMDKNLKFDVLKAAHHGSNKSNSSDFLKYYRPERLIISAGKANKYGLPSPEVLSRAEKLNIDIIELNKRGSYEILIN